MRATSVDKGRTIKTVRVVEISSTDSDADVLAVALKAAGETRSSLFGWDIQYWTGGSATVTLNTD